MKRRPEFKNCMKIKNENLINRVKLKVRQYSEGQRMLKGQSR
jgi:hypothetical protein